MEILSAFKKNCDENFFLKFSVNFWELKRLWENIEFLSYLIRISVEISKNFDAFKLNFMWIMKGL